MLNITSDSDTESRFLGALQRENLIAGKHKTTLLREGHSHAHLIETILPREFAISPLNIAHTYAKCLNIEFINPAELPPNSSALNQYGAAAALEHGLLPWRWIGDSMVILVPSTDHFKAHQDALTSTFGKVRLAISTPDLIATAIQSAADFQLAHDAENKVDADLSSRGWNSIFALGVWAILGAILIAGLYSATTEVLIVLSLIAITSLLLNTLLKAAAMVACIRSKPTPVDTSLTDKELPFISILVPIFQETEIAEHLVKKLQAIDYPRSKLDLCIVMESDDTTTREALGRTVLPLGMRLIVVPQGTLRTKPRAMNYALNFAKGSIIGVYDAEDAPAPNQLRHVAAQFAVRPKHVACLQGVLDYYNARANWVTRCFTIEYASWFRVMLPGLQRLGLVVPLGGTTLFFRRDILQKLGGWDAHNVTEDADLGVRLARFGYTTELITSVTKEEANGRVWPWIKQRSRWLKGFAITYAVHMRTPSRLLRDLGAWRFCGVQVLFAGTLAQFLLAPVLWSFWIIPFGWQHPFADALTQTQFWTMVYFFFAAECINLAINALALHRSGKHWLIKWAITLPLYFPLASLAAYKGLLELAWKPFYWDKTAHGVLLPEDNQT